MGQYKPLKDYHERRILGWRPRGRWIKRMKEWKEEEGIGRLNNSYNFRVLLLIMALFCLTCTVTKLYNTSNSTIFSIICIKSCMIIFIYFKISTIKFYIELGYTNLHTWTIVCSPWASIIRLAVCVSFRSAMNQVQGIQYVLNSILGTAWNISNSCCVINPEIHMDK